MPNSQDTMFSIDSTSTPLPLPTTPSLPFPPLRPPPVFPVPFITPESPDPVVLGSSITLTCGSYGIRPFNLTWSMNGILLARAEEVNTTLSLTVDLVSTDNSTSYTCTSQNRHGVHITSVTLEQAGTATVCVMSSSVEAYSYECS